MAPNLQAERSETATQESAIAEQNQTRKVDVPQPASADDRSTDAVADASPAPTDDVAGGPTADKAQTDEPSDEEAAAQLGDFA